MSRKEKEFKVSDESVNTHGFIVLTSGGRFDRFKANPVMLFRHYDYQVIGAWKDLEVRGSEIFATAIFDWDDPEAATIAGKVERGFMRMASIGIIPYKVVLNHDILTQGEPTPVVIDWELREISVCPFGSNKNALAMYDSAGNPLDLADRQTLLKLCDASSTIENLTTKDDMEQLKKLLELKAKATAEEVAEAVTELRDERNALVESTTTLTAERDALDAKVKEFEAKELAALKAEALALTEAAIADGRLNADAKDSTLAMFEKDHEGAKALLASIPKRKTAEEFVESGNQPLSDMAKMSWDELDKAGRLSELKSADRATFNSKFKEKFGKEPEQ